MNEKPNVVIVTARCIRSAEHFGIRFEEQARGQWFGDWAFAMQERAARKEGYTNSEISGSLGLTTGYPGCPYCHSGGLYKCNCGRVACWDRETQAVVCPWCKCAGYPSGPVESLQAGGDR